MATSSVVGAGRYVHLVTKGLNQTYLILDRVLSLIPSTSRIVRYLLVAMVDQVATRLTVIGCGTLGSSIVGGLLTGFGQQYDLNLTGRRPEHVEKLSRTYPQAYATINNKDARIWETNPGQNHVVVIATQPEFTKTVCSEISEALERYQLDVGGHMVVVTLCPGITTAMLATWLPPDVAIMRTMPNTPVFVKQGTTATFAAAETPVHLVQEVERIFHTISPVVERLPRENLLDVAASISG